MPFSRRFSLVLSSLTLLFLTSFPALALESHQNIRGPFASIADVTKTCLKCHQQQALEVLQSTHWTWVRQRTINGKNTLFGKKDSLTGFAIDVSSNPARCMGCHISNTRPEVNLDTPGPEMVDCLVCHDTTGMYRQPETSAATQDTPEILEQIARNIGKPGPRNCMTCHFADCGLSASNTSDKAPPRKLQKIQDVHLNGATPFSCQTCHTRHNGHGFSRAISRNNDSSHEQGCAACHTKSPHNLVQLNQHMTVISCQTCHIPEFAQQTPMIISWNWLMSGKLGQVFLHSPDGRAFLQDKNGFTAARQLEPVYLWDDGSDEIYTRGQRIVPGKMTSLQKPSERNTQSKISPFRVIYGTQLYDAKYRYLISPLLGDAGAIFPPDSDWQDIAGKGMQAIVLPFSGQYAFTATEIFQRINHGIAPAAEALGCIDCHGSNSRMPWKELGYDNNPWMQEQEVGRTEEKTTSKPNPTQIQNYSQFSRR